MKNTIVESTFGNAYSTYVKCDCGAEILEFQVRESDLMYKSEIEDVTLTTSSDDPEFALHYHGLLSRCDIKYGYNDFYFTDTAQLKAFITLLKKAVDKNVEGDVSGDFYDELLPCRIRKRYGQGGISVTHSKSNLFTCIQKYKNLKKKGKPSWEIVLREGVLKDFISNMEQVTKQAETTFNKKHSSWITVLPE